MEGVQKSRIHWVDNARALAMISMVVYHTMWDLVYIFGMRASWFYSNAAFVWQQSICWTFILLSGFCSSMSRHLWKRGLFVSFWGIVIMLVTHILMPENSVWFGVLTLIGSCNLLMAVLKKYVQKVPPIAGFMLSLAGFAMTYHIQKGYIMFGGVKILQLPKILYQNLFTAFLGFPTANFASVDYFPVLPWALLFFCGVYGRILWEKYKLRLPEFCNLQIPILSQISKYSLVLYVLHQPIIYGVLEVAVLLQR